MQIHPRTWIKAALTRAAFEFRGAAEGTRTPDPIITNDVLYQLSYCGTVAGI